jgi:hypothetical protein
VRAQVQPETDPPMTPTKGLAPSAINYGCVARRGPNHGFHPMPWRCSLATVSVFGMLMVAGWMHQRDNLPMMFVCLGLAAFGVYARLVGLPV